MTPTLPATGASAHGCTGLKKTSSMLARAVVQPSQRFPASHLPGRSFIKVFSRALHICSGLSVPRSRRENAFQDQRFRWSRARRRARRNAACGAVGRSGQVQISHTSTPPRSPAGGLREALVGRERATTRTSRGLVSAYRGRGVQERAFSAFTAWTAIGTPHAQPAAISSRLLSISREQQASAPPPDTHGEHGALGITASCAPPRCRAQPTRTAPMASSRPASYRSAPRFE